MGFLKPQLPQVGENVFFAGDVQSGASLVVRAMASGHAAAALVDEYLCKL
jgi:glutamate synthase (NADPH/NADH) small chain